MKTKPAKFFVAGWATWAEALFGIASRDDEESHAENERDVAVCFSVVPYFQT